MTHHPQLPAGLTALIGQVALIGDAHTDMVAFLRAHGQAKVIGHSIQVAAEARRLATHFGLVSEAAERAGWLQDISAIVPNDQRIALAEALGIDVLPEERAVPMIVHQKLSA